MPEPTLDQLTGTFSDEIDPTAPIVPMLKPGCCHAVS
jgi:hypothetical protein